jgi:hypothetical protein
MKTAPSKPTQVQRLDKKRGIILNVLLAVCALWFPLSYILNPGWYTLALMVRPYILLAALIPLVTVKLANLTRPKDERLPRGLFRMEIVFCILWILFWCFSVNGGDTEDSIHSIFSRIFGGIWGEKALVSLSGTLFGCTMLVLLFLAFCMVAYKRSGEDARRAVWGRRLLLTNFVNLSIGYALNPLLGAFGVFPTSDTIDTWNWVYVTMSAVSGILGVLNVIYLLRYFLTHDNVRAKIWVAGVAGIIISLYFIWGSARLLMLMAGVNVY